MKSISLKKLFAILIVFAITTGQFVFSQDDSTKIKDKKVIIVDDNSTPEDIEELEKELDEIDADLEEAELEKAEVKEEIKEELKELEEALEELAEELEEEFGDNYDGKCSSKKSKCNKFKGHWAGFEFGLNNYVVKDLDFNLPAESEFMTLKPNLSWTFALNLPEINIPLYNKYVGFVSGLGIEWDNYRLKENMDLVVEDGIIVPQPIDIDYRKNTLNAVYLNLPIILEAQIPVTKGGNRAFVGVGVVGGVKIHSTSKKEYVDQNQEQKLKNNDDYNINPFKYGLTARLGYKDASLFVNYSISTLFEENKGPELYPVSIGLRIDF